tara:strand:- start:479 stop:1393 length:915 start_codon:yes stop_codon:yes gene_type:complete
MENKNINYNKTKKKYLRFLKSQEVLSEPFRDKIGQLHKFYLPLSKMISRSYLRKKSTTIIGLTGGQGSGKSTISNILKIILKEKYDYNTIIFSIDDFYKTLRERELMAKKISPLFTTRGVPGTHDTTFLYRTLKNLKSRKFRTMQIPKFDKSIDDRAPKKKWQNIKKKPDIVIFEGWCVGAVHQKKKDLLRPINTLERDKDKNKIWRFSVNNELKHKYKIIFSLIDKIIFLKVPSFKYVFKWRLLQEKKLKISSKGKKIMSSYEIKNFIMYYERITKRMLKTLKKSDSVINIDKKHRLSSIKFN